MRNLLLLLPPELVVFLIMGGGFALMLNAKRLAMTLFGAAVAIIFLPALLEPVLEILPGWLLNALLLVFGVGLVLTLLQFLIGNKAARRLLTTSFAELLRLTVLVPLGVVAILVSRFFR